MKQFYLVDIPSFAGSYAELELGSEFELPYFRELFFFEFGLMYCDLWWPPEHSATQDPHPDGNPLHEAGNGGRKHDPLVSPLVTSQELFLHVTWQDLSAPVEKILKGSV